MESNPPAEVLAALGPILAQAPGKVAIACHHLQTGERWALGDRPMPAASLIKVHLAVAAYQAAERGELDLREKVLVPVLPGDDEAEFDNLGRAPAVGHAWRKVIDRMLTESDNAATNALVDRLGLDAVAPLVERLGLRHTALRRRMLDTAAREAGRENTLTASEMVALLVALARGELLGSLYTRELLELLGQVRDDEKLEACLPAGVKLAHKTGELPGYRHDAGLVFDGESTWALAVLAEGDAEADAILAQVASALHQHFAGAISTFERASRALDDARQRLIADPRLAHDSLRLEWDAGDMVLRGETTVPERLDLTYPGRREARLLEGAPAVVTVPCLQLRGGPGHARELVSQLRLGDPLAVLESGADWTLLRGPDGYVARGKANNLAGLPYVPTHAVAAPLVTTTAEDGGVFQLSAGSRLAWDEAAGAFRLPDGRTVDLSPDETVPLGSRGTVDDLLALAERFLGLPYLWGGTTGWGIDCSGLVQLCYFVMGVALPRDADQQQHATEAVAAIDELAPGDLVFFPGHVGLYLGGGEFVHASAKAGMVTLNSFDKAAPRFDDWLFENFSGGGRSPLRASAAVV